MNAIPYKDHHPPRVEIERLIDRHGLRPILLAVLALALRGPASRKADTGRLGNHLRRDIGLPPLPKSRKYWELR